MTHHEGRENGLQLHAYASCFIYSRVGNFDTKPDFGEGKWLDHSTNKFYKLEFNTSCGLNRNGRFLTPFKSGGRFQNGRPAPVTHVPVEKRTPRKKDKEDDGEKDEKDKDESKSESEEEEKIEGEDEDDENERDGGETLEKPGTLTEKITWIAAGSICGLVTLIAIFGFLFVRRKKAKRQREFMENNPIYGDDYYYSPVKANDEKVEYYEVTKNNVEKQDT